MSIRSTDNSSVSLSIVLDAYRQGYFPMADESGRIGFYAYEPRGIIPLDDRFTVRRSLRQILRRTAWQIRFDTSPQEVLRACSRHGVVSKQEIWLSDELIECYLGLFSMGYLHTVEVWTDGAEGESELIGGLYGLAFGAAFCGESMFSRQPYASQFALVQLVEHLRIHGFQLLDAQMSTDHLKQFGLYECTQREYLRLFNSASSLPATF